MRINKNIINNYLTLALRIRSLEEKISKEYKNQEMRCPVHLSLGQEIPSAAINTLLNEDDFAISYHRAHAHYISKGGDINKLIAEIYGKKTGCSKGVGGSMHLIDLNKNFIGSTAIVSGSIPVGVGFAYSLLLKNSKKRVCIFIGDSSVEEGVFFESLNFSVLKNLPVIFFCENNKYSVYSNIEKRQPKNRKISEMVKSFGIKSFSLSTKNPIKFLKDLRKILKNNLKKPIFIEVETYRFVEHCGPNNDDILAYRPKREINYWLKNDPLKKLSKFVLKKKYLSRSSLNKLKKKIDSKTELAFKFAKKSPKPKFNEYLKYND